MYIGAAGTNGVCSYLHALITTVAVALKSLGCNLRHQIRCLQNEQSLMQQEVMNPAWHPTMKPKHGWLMWFRLIQSWTLFVLLCTSASFWSTTHYNASFFQFHTGESSSIIGTSRWPRGSRGCRSCSVGTGHRHRLSCLPAHLSIDPVLPPSTPWVSFGACHPLLALNRSHYKSILTLANIGKKRKRKLQRPNDSTEIVWGYGSNGSERYLLTVVACRHKHTHKQARYSIKSNQTKSNQLIMKLTKVLRVEWKVLSHTN